MAYTDQYGTFFGRPDEYGNIEIMHVDDGYPATRLDASVYPLSYDGDGNVACSWTSARYEHASGIVLSRADAESLGIEIEE